MSISKRILIVGGYGKAGTNIAKLLIKNSSNTITLAGRNSSKAQKVAEGLNHEFHTKQAHGISLDIANITDLRTILSLYDILIVCLPFPKNSPAIVETIVNADINYIDLVPDKSKNHLFKKHHFKLTSHGRTCLLEAGWEPGLPALLVRLANQKLNTQAKKVNIHAVYRDRDMPAGSIADIIGNANFKQQIFEANQWKKISMLNTNFMNLPEPWGRMMGFPTELSELQELPQKLNLDSLKLYQGGHNWISDLILFLLTVFGFTKGSFVFNQGVKLFQWANQTFTNPASAGIIKVMASNSNESVTVTASNMDLYKSTAIPVVASVLLMNQEAINPGTGFMGQCLPPQKTTDLIKEMGITISINSESVVNEK